MGTVVHSEHLKTQGLDWTDKAMTNGGTYYSDTITQHAMTGFCSLLVLTSAGSLAITYEVSDNGDTWYTPYDTDDNALNTVSAAVTANRWIAFSPSVANFTRFKFVLSSTNSTVSAIFRYAEGL